jgi:hypothetical protein
MGTPVFPVNVGGDTIPKMNVEGNGTVGHLIIEPEDLSGTYDYIPDVGSMSQMAPEEKVTAMSNALTMATGVDPKTGQPSGLNAMMREEKKKVKATELFTDILEESGFKDADQYIESIEPTPQPPMGGIISNVQGQTQPGGSPGVSPVGAGGGMPPVQGMAGSPPPIAPVQA